MREKSMEKVEKTEEGIKQKGTESKEAEKLAPVFLIYRDNDLFMEWIPKITETLQRIGRKVEIWSFAAGIERKEIDEWMNEHKEEFEGKEIAADRTIGASDFWGRDGVGARVKDEDRGGGYLDHLLGNIALKVAARKIFGKDYNDGLLDEFGAEGIKITGKIFPGLIQEILRDKKNIPEKVYLSGMHILDHNPFRDELKDDRNAWEKAMRFVKRWLVKGGIPEERIEDYEEVSKEQNVDNSKNWVIVDRHNYYEIKRLVSAKKLRFPLVDFLDSAIKQGLVQQISTEELEKEVNKKLEEDFGEESREEK